MLFLEESGDFNKPPLPLFQICMNLMIFVCLAIHLCHSLDFVTSDAQFPVHKFHHMNEITDISEA